MLRPPLILVFLLVRLFACQPKTQPDPLSGILKQCIVEAEQQGRTAFQHIQFQIEKYPHYKNVLIEARKWEQGVEETRQIINRMSRDSLQMGFGQKLLQLTRHQLMQGTGTDSLDLETEAFFARMLSRKPIAQDSIERLALQWELLQWRNRVFMRLHQSIGGPCTWGVGWSPSVNPSHSEQKRISFDVKSFLVKSELNPIPYIQTLTRDGVPIEAEPFFEVVHTKCRMGFDSLAPGNYEISGQDYLGDLQRWTPFRFRFRVLPDGSLDETIQHVH